MDPAQCGHFDSRDAAWRDLRRRSSANANAVPAIAGETRRERTNQPPPERPREAATTPTTIARPTQRIKSVMWKYPRGKGALAQNVSLNGQAANTPANCGTGCRHL